MRLRTRRSDALSDTSVCSYFLNPVAVTVTFPAPSVATDLTYLEVELADSQPHSPAAGNEVPDAVTGEPVYIKDDRMMFIVTPKDTDFPEALAMKKYEAG